MITVVINGQNYYYPEVGDTDWGSIATLAFDAITKTTLQPVKDLNDPTVVNDFTLYNDIDFGPTHGLRVLFIQSRSNNPAATGVFRLAKDELVAWRNEDNDGDNTISFDADGDLIVNGVKVTLHGQIVNDDIAAGAGIEESKLALDYSTDSLHTDIDNHVNDTANPHLTNLVNLVDTTIVTPAGNDTLLYDSNDSKWKNIPNTISNVSDVTVASVADGDVLVYDSNDSDWKNSDVVSSHVSDTNNPHSVTKAQILTGDLIVNADVDASAAIAESKLDLDYSTDSLNTAITTHTADTSNPHSTSLDNLTNTEITTPANGDVLKYDGTKWINGVGGGGSSTLSGLTDTDITTPADGDVLIYDSNDSEWKNSDQLSTLDSTVTTHVANTSNPHSTSVSNLTDTNVSSLNDSDILVYDSGDSEWKNTQLSLKRLVDTAISSEASGDALIYDGNDWINKENSVDNLTNTDIDTNTLAENDVLVFNDQTLKWENSQIMVNHIGSTANPHLTTVAKLTDVSISSASNNDTLLYDSNDSEWKNKPNSVDNLSNVTITSVTSGDVLTYDGSGWINSPASGGSVDLGYKNISGWGLVESKSYASININTSNWLKVTGSVGYNYATQTEYPITANTGMSISSLTADTMYYVMYSPANSGVIVVKFADCYAQASEPTFSQDAVWFDTNSNTFISGKGASDWQSATYNDLCVPFCIIMNGQVYQLFDRFASSFMDRLFLYPNQKMLFPHGRDTDGTYLNEVGYTVGSTNQMKTMLFIKSTYKGLHCLAGVSPATTYSKKANDVYITDQDTNIGSYLLPHLPSNSQVFSTVQNNWFTSSDGIQISGTSFNSKIAYVPLYENEDGYITKIENKIFIDLATKDQVKDLATKYNVAYIGATPQDRTLASSTVYLASIDNRNQVITATDGYTIVLPSDGIKAGDRFTFEWTDDFSSLVNPFDFTAGGNTVVSISTPNNKVEIVALVDNPVSNTDWKSGAIKAASTPESLSTLADTTISSPQNGELLQYNYVSSKWENSNEIPTRIEINDIANINSASTAVTLTASDKRHQIFTASNGFSITLPSTGIKAGEKFAFEWTSRSNTTGYTTPFSIYSSNSSLIAKAYMGYFRYEFIARIDNPTSDTDWYFNPNNLVEYVFKSNNDFKNSINLTANTLYSAISSTVMTFCPAVWEIGFRTSYCIYNPNAGSKNGARLVCTYNGAETMLIYDDGSMIGNYSDRNFTIARSESGMVTLTTNNGNLAWASPYSVTGVFTQKYLKSMAVMVRNNLTAYANISNVWYQNFINARLVAPITGSVLF